MLLSKPVSLYTISLYSGKPRLLIDPSSPKKRGIASIYSLPIRIYNVSDHMA